MGPGAPVTPLPERGRTGRLVAWVAVLILANVLADVAVGSPTMVLPQLLAHFDSDHAAWLNASAMLAGAIWSPLLAKSSDIVGKRRTLIITLLLAGSGALICLVAPGMWMFLAGRFLQGAAFAAVFITVALVRQICTRRVSVTAVGLVTSGSSVAGIVEPFVMTPVIDAYGYRSVFVVAATLAAVAAISVRCVIPESPLVGTGRIDIGGALLLGGGLAAVLGYVSLGRDLGWLSAGMLALLSAGAASLAGWAVLAVRIEEPLVDLRTLSRPLLLCLLALALAAGSFRSMLQLTGIVAQVPPSLGLGYGLGAGESVAVLLAAPNLGIVIGGVCAGWLTGRLGPALPLLGGIGVGTAATAAMLAGVSLLAVAVMSGLVLGVAAGAIGTAGYNLAIDLAPPERQCTVAGLVSVVLALGSVVVTVGGGEVLRAAAVPGIAALDVPPSTTAGVQVYVLVAAVLFALSALPAITLARRAAGPW